MCWDSHSEFTHSHLNLRHSPTDQQMSVFTFAVVVVLYFRAGCTALLTAILSDSLPCLICYHETRWYTYTHSAFWSFWLYGKIQMYPLPKRYRQFFLLDTPWPNPWYLSLLVKRASVTRRTNRHTCITLCPVSVGALSILSRGHFAR